MVMTGQPVQEMQPQLDSMTGMPVQPVAAPMPNQAVYNNPMAINAANRIYGSPQMRQNSVMMTKAQENT
jgi:hypothetical protein